MKKTTSLLLLITFLFYCSFSSRASASLGSFSVSKHQTNGTTTFSQDAAAWPGMVAAIAAAVGATVAASYAAGYAAGQFAYHLAHGNQEQLTSLELNHGTDSNFSKFDYPLN